MKITLSDVPTYIAFRHPGLGETEKAEKAARMAETFAAWSEDSESIFLAKDGRGRIEGAIHRFRLQAGSYGAGNVTIAEGLDDPAVFRRLLIACQPVPRLAYRLVSGPLAEGRQRVLIELGYRAGEKREEFRRELAGLPGDEGSPLRWEPLPDLSEKSLDRTAEFLKRCGEGDPDFSSDDDAHELVRVYLRENGLSAGPECVQFGSVAGEPMALVVAQVQASNGWSRITYMGMLPAFRGRGLGAWVHRHGFVMLREQGGKLYHGGTLARNRAMIRLFEKHGCAPYRSMQEWTA